MWVFTIKSTSEEWIVISHPLPQNKLTASDNDLYFKLLQSISLVVLKAILIYRQFFHIVSMLGECFILHHFTFYLDNAFKSKSGLNESR